MGEETSLDESINLSTLDEGTVTDTPEIKTEEPKANNKSNVAKLLAERNAAKKELEELRAQKTINGEVDIQAEIQKGIAMNKAAENAEIERGKLLANFGEDKLAEVDGLIEKHPTLTPAEAATLMGLETKTTNPNKFAMAGNTPQSFKQKKTVADLSDADLLEGMRGELQGLGYRA